MNGFSRESEREHVSTRSDYICLNHTLYISNLITQTQTMTMFRLICTIALLVYTAAAQQPPHLSQAWQAMSAGDGLPNDTIGQESYLYEGCKERSETCMNGHVYNYKKTGAANCIKYEIDQGGKSRLSGTFYVSCDGGLNCCMKVKSGPERIPKVKKWDIGMAGALFKDQITYLGKKDTTELNNKPVTGADTWLETFTIPFTGVKVNYTYYVTTNGTDVITHRIDYGASKAKGAVGSILYGDFQPQHNITAFRSVFTPPAACQTGHVMQCPKGKVEEWEETYFN